MCPAPDQITQALELVVLKLLLCWKKSTENSALYVVPGTGHARSEKN